MLNIKNPEKEKITVIADDLTGANEIAALLVRKGKKCLVLNDPLQREKIGRQWNEYDGLVFNLNSRSLSGIEASRRVRDYLAFPEIREKLIYKKVDSTVRGNIEEELNAVMDSDFVDVVVFAPAFPEMRRQTVGGYHLVEGLPVGKTPYAENRRKSSLLHRMEQKLSFPAGYLHLDIIEKGPAVIIDHFRKNCRQGKLVIICDCASREDLINLGKAIMSSELKILPTGSAGLFEELFPDSLSSFSPCLLVCGSLNRRTRVQMEEMKATEETGHLEVDLPPEENNLRELKERGESILSEGKNLLISTPEKKWRRQGIEGEISQFLASFAIHFIKSYSFSGIIAIGGDTATALLQNLHVSDIEIIDEIEPYVPASIIKDGKVKNTLIITKTGGFGSRQVFLKATEYLKKRREKK